MPTEHEYLRQTLDELRTQLKENKAELKAEITDLRKEILLLNSFLSELKGGKHFLWGIIWLMAGIGAILSYFGLLHK